jgi:hypothetical protein
VIDDWFSLLNHEHLVTATGNSDTHHLTFNIGGYPRNYIHLRDDRPAMLNTKLVAQAIKGHHVFFTTGPIVDLVVNGGRIGDLVLAKGGKARAELTVKAAPWISVDRVILYVNGRELKRWVVPAAAAASVLRFHETVDLDVPADGYVVARVDGDKPLAPVVGDRRTFTAYPFALTNPVFLDVNGDGHYRGAFPHGHK